MKGDRNRLIELLTEKLNCELNDYQVEEVADYLLANGVIVPPCKVGDIVYTVGVFTGQIIENEVMGIHYDGNEMFLFASNGTVITVGQHLGKTVFLTKEEAEEKLEELNDNA